MNGVLFLLLSYLLSFVWLCCHENEAWRDEGEEERSYNSCRKNEWKPNEEQTENKLKPNGNGSWATADKCFFRHLMDAKKIWHYWATQLEVLVRHAVSMYPPRWIHVFTTVEPYVCHGETICPANGKSSRLLGSFILIHIRKVRSMTPFYRYR